MGKRAEAERVARGAADESGLPMTVWQRGHEWRWTGSLVGIPRAVPVVTVLPVSYWNGATRVDDGRPVVYINGDWVAEWREAAR